MSIKHAAIPRGMESYVEDIVAPRAGPRIGGCRPKSLCPWPTCDTFATTEIKRGLGMAWAPLCPTHRRAWDLLGDWDHEAIAWQPRRKRVAA